MNYSSIIRIQQYSEHHTNFVLFARVYHEYELKFIYLEITCCTTIVARGGCVQTGPSNGFGVTFIDRSCCAFFWHSSKFASTRF